MRILPGVKTLLSGLSERVTNITAGIATQGPSAIAEAVDTLILLNRVIDQTTRYRDTLKDWLRGEAKARGLGTGAAQSMDLLGTIGSAQVTISPRAPAALRGTAVRTLQVALGEDVFADLYTRKEEYAPVKDWRARFKALPPEVRKLLESIEACWSPETSASVKSSK